MELREEIIAGVIPIFNAKGLKFTMDDLAKQLKMSKKTIYTVFKDKEDMFFSLVDYIFDSVRDSKTAVMMDQSLSTVDKLRKLLGVMPEGYRAINFQKLYVLKERYPMVYKRVEERLESGWEGPISLIEQGMREGVIRPICIPLVKMMMESSLEQFFQRDILVRNGLTYAEALEQVVGILVDGITK